MTIKKFLRMAREIPQPKDYQRIAMALSLDDTRTAVDELDSLIQGAARMRAYLNVHAHKCMDHGKGVKAGQSLVTKIRRALGYTYPKDNLTF